MSHLYTGFSSVHAATFTVCPSVSCDFTTIQAAIDAANDGDIIKVAMGVYTDVSMRPRNDIVNTGFVTQVVYISKSVTIQGGYTTGFNEPPAPETNLTKLDAQGHGRAIYITGEISPTIEGLFITQGDATNLGGDNSYGPPDTDAGGGVYVITATAMISNSVLFDNIGGVGGGVHLQNSSALIENSIIFSNTANNSGGGIYINSNMPLIRYNTISTNMAGDTGGGSSLVNSQGILSNNIIISNTAGYAGGGLILANSQSTLDMNNIVGNIAGGPGGGLLLNFSDVVLNGNTIAGNVSGIDDFFNGSGGGLFLTDSNPFLVNNIIVDNEIVGNSVYDQGSAIYIQVSSPRLLHTTIAHNIGHSSGIYINDDPTPNIVSLTNTIFVSHTVGINVSAGHTVTLESTLWGNGDWANGMDTKGTGTIIRSHDYIGYPKFVDYVSGDYHLLSDSIAIDKGITTGVIVDIDGQNRDTLPDLGADEHVTIEEDYNITSYLPIVLKD